MKKPIFNLILGVLILALTACWRDNSPAPLKFNAYEHNPVLSPGEQGSWDDFIVILPCVIYHNNVFHLFYTGINKNGINAIGLATSADGYHFSKSDKNPVLTQGGSGFDAFATGAPVIVRQDSVWVMYYNGSEIAGWGPGPSVGIAKAGELSGPWIKNKEPVLTSGKPGEWDADFVFVSSVLLLDDGSYRMYYSGGDDFDSHENYCIGMASSPDGITWKKYNDPATDQHPFAESDPVLMDGKDGEWDDANEFIAFVYKDAELYKMYYMGSGFRNKIEFIGFGFATSVDGIHWEKYPGNPIFRVEDDPYNANYPTKEKGLEGPSLVFLDTVCFMYYDYATIIGEIGMATATLNQTIRNKEE